MHAPAALHARLESASDNRLHYLDGLRGWAALAVLFCHTFQVWLFNPAWASQRGLAELNLFIYSTPLGVMLDSQLAVNCFFVISGIALSYPIISSSDPRTMLRNMAVYRYFRLAIPTVASVAFAYVLWSTVGFWNVEAGTMSESAWLKSFYSFSPSVLSAVKYALWDCFFYLNKPSYNAVLWTMGFELIGSFALFSLLIFDRRIRIPAATLALLWITFFETGNLKNYFGFFSGYLIAEFLIRRPTPILGAGLFVAALSVSVLSYYPAAQYSWNAVPAFIKWAWWPNSNNLTATTLVAGVVLSPLLRRAMSAPVSKVLGALSFPLYLVHLPIICSFGSMAFVFAAKLSLTAAIIAAAITTLSLSFATAYLFHRGVEMWFLTRIKRTLRHGASYRTLRVPASN